MKAAPKSRAKDPTFESRISLSSKYLRYHEVLLLQGNICAIPFYYLTCTLYLAVLPLPSNALIVIVALPALLPVPNCI